MIRWSYSKQATLSLKSKGSLRNCGRSQRRNSTSELLWPGSIPGLAFIRPEGEVAYRLADRAAAGDEMLILALIHYGSRAAVDIDGLGEASSRLLVGAGLVSDLADIYTLLAKELEQLERFGELSSRNLIEAIAGRKQPPLNRFIFGLGIPRLGTQKAADLARHFKTWDAFVAASRQEWEELKGIGAETADSIASWLAAEPNRRLLAKLAEAGVRPVSLQVATSPLSGKNLVITGTLQKL